MFIDPQFLGEEKTEEADSKHVWTYNKVKYRDIAVRSLTCHTATGTHMP